MSNILCKTKCVCSACGQERDSFNVGKKQGAVKERNEIIKLLENYYNENWFVLLNKKSLEEARITRNIVRKLIKQIKKEG